MSNAKNLKNLAGIVVGGVLLCIGFMKTITAKQTIDQAGSLYTWKPPYTVFEQTTLNNLWTGIGILVAGLLIMLIFGIIMRINYAGGENFSSLSEGLYISCPQCGEHNYSGNHCYNCGAVLHPNIKTQGNSQKTKTTVSEVNMKPNQVWVCPNCKNENQCVDICVCGTRKPE